MTGQGSENTAAATVDTAVGTAAAIGLVDDSPEKLEQPAFCSTSCLNCGASVRGRYCIDCGQVTDTHLPTLAEVVSDAITSLFNLDSRLWRTTLTMFFQPGRLTQDFLAGKRARYVPPLRLYLVISVFLFLITSLNPTDDDDNIDEFQNTQVTQVEENAIVEAVKTEVDASSTDSDRQFDCEMVIPGIARGGMIDNALREACLEGKADNFDSLKDAFLDNIPLLIFLVIPVMAVVFKLFYLFSGRIFLAHLVFLCHTHGFTFLLFIVLTLLQILGGTVPALNTLTSILGGLLFVLYLPTYYFLALRRVYGQGVFLTLFKLFTLMFIYLFAALIVFSIGFVVLMLVS